MTLTGLSMKEAAAQVAAREGGFSRYGSVLLMFVTYECQAGHQVQAMNTAQAVKEAENGLIILIPVFKNIQ